MRSQDYASQAERITAQANRVGEAIDRHDPNCWGENIGIVRFYLSVKRTRRSDGADAFAEAIWRLIQRAVGSDALECLTTLHSEEYSPSEVPAYRGRSLIHQAARCGANRVLAWFIDEQIFDVDARAEDGTSPLHHAAREGLLTTVDVLLERRAFIDAASNRGETPVHVAIRHGRIGVLRRLIEAGANLGATVGEETPLALAANVGRSDCATLLLQSGAPTTNAAPALFQILGSQILKHSRLDKCPRGALANLFAWVDGAQAQMLIEYGADPLIAGPAALRNTNHELLHVIEEFGRYQYTEAHFQAAAHSSLGMRQLLEGGADPDTWVTGREGRRLPIIFHLAVEPGTDVNGIAILLDHGADPTPPENAGLGPLLVELTKRLRAKPSLIERLVERGQDVNSRDLCGRSALHELLNGCWVSSAPHVLLSLIRCGADVNMQEEDGLTPLMHAVSLPNKEALLFRTEKLLRAGAFVDTQDARGATAFHHFFRSDCGDLTESVEQALIELLVAHSEKALSIRDRHGRYPEEVGEDGKHQRQRAYVRRLRVRACWQTLSISDRAPGEGLGSRPRPQPRGSWV